MARHHDLLEETLLPRSSDGTPMFEIACTSAHSFLNNTDLCRPIEPIEPIDIRKTSMGNPVTTTEKIKAMTNQKQPTDVEVSTENFGALTGGLGGEDIVIINDPLPIPEPSSLRDSARYISFCNAVIGATNDPSAVSLDELADHLVMLIQDDRQYKGCETHKLIMQSKLRALFKKLLQGKRHSHPMG